MIKTSRRVFLVKFVQSTEQYIVQDNGLFHLLQEMDDMDLESIKCSESYTVKFKRCSKALILKQFDWNTEIIQFLTKLPYFKGVKYQ